MNGLFLGARLLSRVQHLKWKTDKFMNSLVSCCSHHNPHAQLKSLNYYVLVIHFHQGKWMWSRDKRHHQVTH